MKAATALLIIDVQIAMIEGDTQAVLGPQILANLNMAISKARASGMPVIFIQHDGPVQSDMEADCETWNIHPSLNRLDTDVVIRKTVGDCFYAPALRYLLQKLGVHRLWIGGCSTDFCVDTAVRAALSHDYEVTVIADGHTCRDRPFVKGETVIDHFNWVWREMIEAPKPLHVTPVADLVP
ncbi:isochorismatase family protein [Lysobacter gummosus]|uniref:Isochorismatase family protein n=1 Tax=Lysobacter gummosus TaxID=262324 RepID=A0ABY3XCM0_9GAMM|nr:isochorismatase family protein [Lysobacter gummosus]UNP29261.1 isochorismatase family protein [Lysobacter gummosus]